MRQLARPLDVAVVGELLAGDEAEDGGLAGAVGPDEADLLAGVDLERRVDEEDLRAVLLGDVGKRDHVRREVLAQRRHGCRQNVLQAARSPSAAPVSSVWPCDTMTRDSFGVAASCWSSVFKPGLSLTSSEARRQ